MHSFTCRPPRGRRAYAWRGVSAFRPYTCEPLENRRLLSGASEEHVALAAAPVAASAAAAPDGYQRTLDIYIMPALYAQTQAAVDTWIRDLAAEGYRVTMRQYPGSAADLRNQLRARWQNDGLEGAVFVGNYPTVTSVDFRSWDTFETGEPGPAVYPHDLYFMDLDGDYDLDHQPYSRHEDGSGDVAPEIYMSRICADNLGQITGGRTEAQLISDYLWKVHMYRTGMLTYENRGLMWIDDDWSGMWNASYMAGLYSQVTFIDDPQQTTRDSYLAYAAQDYESVIQAIHSNPGGLAVEGVGGGWITSEQIVAANPRAAFFNLFDCSASRFTEENALINAYVYGGDFVLGAVGSSKPGAMLHHTDYYGPLTQGDSVGQAFLKWFQLHAPATNGQPVVNYDLAWFNGMTMQGDPTLRPKVMGGPHTGAISGTVFNDLNANGVRDAGEQGIAGRRVFLDTDGNGMYDSARERATWTDTLGNYSFTGLAPHFYTVVPLPQSSWTGTAPTGLYGIEFEATLHNLDQRTALAVNPRSTHTGTSVGIAFAPDGALYTLTTDIWSPEGYRNSLYSIDPLSGAATFVCSYPRQTYEGDIDYNPAANLLYGVTPSGEIFALYPGGSAPGVAVIPGAVNCSAMAFTDAGDLYVLDSGARRLLRVAPATGQILWSLDLAGPALGYYAGMDFDPASGALYLADGGPGASQQLYVVDMYDGTLTPVGPPGLAGGLAGLRFAPSPSGTFRVALAIGQTFAGVDIGQVPPATINGNVYDDQDGDATWQSGDAGLAGQTVYLDYNNNGRLDVFEPSAYTDSDGSYSIHPVLPGQYRVRWSPVTAVQTWPRALAGVSYGGVLYDVNLLTGAATNPRNTGISGLVGLAASASGSLYTVTTFDAHSGQPNSLYRLDPATGGATLVGSLGASISIYEGDLAVDPSNGTLYGLYALSGSQYRLLTINTLTGAATAVGEVPGVFDPSAMTFDGGTLYIIDCGTTSSRVLRVDKTTGQTYDPYTIPVVLGPAAGMAFDDRRQQFYIADGMTGAANNLWTLSKAGTLEQVGPLGVQFGLSGLTFMPGDGWHTAAVSENQTLAGCNFFGYEPGIITGTVFNDANRNARRDESESAMPLQVVYIDANQNGLYDDGETFTASDLEGGFTFTGLPPGSVTIAVMPQNGYSQRYARQLLGIGPDGVLYDVDASTGQMSNPRSTGLASTRGITFGPDGYLYLLGAMPPSASLNWLYRAEATTGATTPVGQALTFGVSDAEIDIDPTTGQAWLLTVSFETRQLWKIDLATGQATNPLTLPGASGVRCMAFDSAGGLWMLRTAPDEIRRVSPSTGAVLFSRQISQMPFSPAAMKFDRATGTLYVSEMAYIGQRNLYTLDPSTGTLTLAGQLSIAPGIEGLAFAPAAGAFTCRPWRLHSADPIPAAAMGVYRLFFTVAGTSWHDVIGNAVMDPDAIYRRPPARRRLRCRLHQRLRSCTSIRAGRAHFRNPRRPRSADHRELQRHNVAARRLVRSSRHPRTALVGRPDIHPRRGDQRQHLRQRFHHRRSERRRGHVFAAAPDRHGR